MFMKWSHLPWSHFSDISSQWKNLPTFLLIEYACYALVIASFIHALKNGKSHLLIWMASFITGSANDIFFMALPLVDNFWQAQATIMLTPRLPLYICCVYNLFMYYSMIASWRVGYENKWPEACLTGVFGLLIYYPYDLIGAKHLWWTWHTTDPPISHRIFGVPIGSSLWILTFGACFSFLLTVIHKKYKMSVTLSLCSSALLTTPLMMVVMAMLQVVSLETQGEPTHVGLLVCLCWYAVILILSSCMLVDVGKNEKWLKHRYATCLDPLLGLMLIAYYLVLLYCGNYFNPAHFKSTGIHQTFGPCNTTEIDLTGLSRARYACHSNLRDDWTVNCDSSLSSLNESSSNLYEWYTVCGTPHYQPINQESRFNWLWHYQLNSICILGMLVYSIIFIVLPMKYGIRSKQRQTSPIRELKRRKYQISKKNQ